LQHRGSHELDRAGCSVLLLPRAQQVARRRTVARRGECLAIDGGRVGEQLLDEPQAAILVVAEQLFLRRWPVALAHAHRSLQTPARQAQPTGVAFDHERAAAARQHERAGEPLGLGGTERTLRRGRSGRRAGCRRGAGCRGAVRRGRCPRARQQLVPLGQERLLQVLQRTPVLAQHHDPALRPAVHDPDRAVADRLAGDAHERFAVAGQLGDLVAGPTGQRPPQHLQQFLGEQRAGQQAAQQRMHVEHRSEHAARAAVRPVELERRRGLAAFVLRSAARRHELRVGPRRAEHGRAHAERLRDRVGQQLLETRLRGFLEHEREQVAVHGRVGNHASRALRQRSRRDGLQRDAIVGDGTLLPRGFGRQAGHVAHEVVERDAGLVGGPVGDELADGIFETQLLVRAEPQRAEQRELLRSARRGRTASAASSAA
jgi:hypothetical protein